MTEETGVERVEALALNMGETAVLGVVDAVSSSDTRCRCVRGRVVVSGRSCYLNVIYIRGI